MNVLAVTSDGPPLATARDALDLIADAVGAQAELVCLPASRLADDFFDLRTGLAGEVAQKFVNYRLRLAVIGDISAQLERSSALLAFVNETNRGRQLWFVPSEADLQERLEREPDRP